MFFVFNRLNFMCFGLFFEILELFPAFLITKIGRICHVKSGTDANGLIFKAA